MVWFITFLFEVIRLAVENNFDFRAKFVLDRAGRSVAVDGFEPVVLLHCLEFFLDLPLIFDEAGVHVGRAMHVHPGLPIIERGMLPEISFDQDLGAYRQMKNGVRHQSNAVHVPNPCGFDAADDGASHQGIDVAVGENDESGTERRNDSILELVRKVGGVKQAEGARAENVPLHRGFELTADEHRSLQADVRRRISAPLEPVFQKVDLCRAAGAICAFDDDELSLQFLENSSG